MTVLELLPHLHMISTGFPQVYVWRDDDGLTLVDAGFPGDAPAIAAGLAQIGHSRADVRRLVLTHHHEDHTGAAADVAAWGDIEVIAHQADAAIIRGEQEPGERTLTPDERALFAQLSADIPPAPPCRVDTEVLDGETIGFGGGALVVSGTGHTAGSMGLFVSESSVLFTGDLIVNSPAGPVLGKFNDDTGTAMTSAAAMARLPARLVCFGHGAPLADAALWAGVGPLFTRV